MLLFCVSHKVLLGNNFKHLKLHLGIFMSMWWLCPSNWENEWNRNKKIQFLVSEKIFHCNFILKGLVDYCTHQRHTKIFLYVQLQIICCNKLSKKIARSKWVVRENLKRALIKLIKNSECNTLAGDCLTMRQILQLAEYAKCQTSKLT